MLDESKAPSQSFAESIANTLEWILTALILALTFRAFILEAFQIPTGSMADTLMGDHFRICCSQCGYFYEYNFNPFLQRGHRIVKGNLYQLSPCPRCPSCGYYENPNTLVPLSKGDRILVFKCIYQFIEPKRWDVVVFKNPTEPTENYIKRLIAKPGETVEIIDGDIYINGTIVRKPPKVQQEMWMCVYNNDYQPIRPLEDRFNGHQWKQPFTNDKNSLWKYNPSRPTEFILESPAESINIMFYDTKKGNDFRAVYSYGDPRFYHNIPYCSDLMMNYFVSFQSDAGTIGIGLTKYETLYKAYLNFDSGEMIIEKVDVLGNTEELAYKRIISPPKGETFPVRFSNVDHLLTFEVGKEKLVYDLGMEKDDAGPRLSELEPKALIFGSGNLRIKHLALYRDIHYLDRRVDSRQPVDRAGENNPFTLQKDEYFVMGDNSPDSADSRLWSVEGIGNNGKKYRIGIVPRDYLVGKAFFVYWPSGFKMNPSGKLALIPNVGKMRFIHGGLE